MKLHKEEPPIKCPRCRMDGWNNEGHDLSRDLMRTAQYLRCQQCNLSIIFHYAYQGWENSEEENP